MEKGFVYLDEVVPYVRWKAMYATSDNFTGAPVDGYGADRIVGTDELAAALKSAAFLAHKEGLGLFLWDAYRPQRAVNNFIEWSRQPEDFSTKERHYPNVNREDMFDLGYIAKRSGHSRGSTIDLTLYRLDTLELLDMGGIFDFMDERSHHGAEGIGETAAQNREKLRSIMLACGFTDYSNEWWHYRLKNEPYPDTYFDFPIL